MSLALNIPVKESVQELRRELRVAIPLLQPRIKMLVVMKKAGVEGVSKRELMDSVGACSQSIQNWRSTYRLHGLAGLLTHKKVGFKPATFTEAEHKAIEKKLNDPKNGLRGYKELQQWIQTELGKDVLYNTLLKYSVKNFGSKVKVARKSHIKKDEEAVTTFKKTSAKKFRK